MGAWGEKLYQNDLALDVKEDYITRLKEFDDSEKIINELLENYKDELDDYDDGPIIYLTLADISWKYGRLLPRIKAKALESIDILLKRQKNYEEVSLSEKELYLLKQKFEGEQPLKKKILIKKPYVCDWKDGDVFAYLLESDLAEEKGLAGRYLIIIKEFSVEWDKDIVPCVRLKITKDNTLPETKEELDALEYIQTRISFYPSVFELNNNEKNNEDFIFQVLPQVKEQKKYIDEYGYSNRFLSIILISSKRNIPKKLKYLGNYKDIKKPKEYVVDNVLFYSLLVWKFLEREMIQNYFKYNLKEHPWYQKEKIAEMNLIRKRVDEYIEICEKKLKEKNNMLD